MSLMGEIGSIFELMPNIDNIYVAVSGGVDSMVLMYILSKYKEYKNIIIVHVNHNIHNKSLDMEKHVYKRCQLLGLNYKSINIYLNGDGNIESRARKLRYESIINIMPYKSILFTAHHNSDQVENIFLSIKRGTGIDGLCGINKITNLNDNKLLIRPFLNKSKESILKFAEENNIQYLNDPTNSDINFDRNFIRNEIIPLIKNRWKYFEDKVNNTSQLISNYVKATNEILGSTILEDIVDNNYGLPLYLLDRYTKDTQLILLRYWLKLLKQPLPTQKQLITIYNQFKNKNSKQPKFKMLFSEIRKYKDILYIIPNEDKNDTLLPKDIMQWIKLPYSMGRLSWTDQKPRNAISFSFNLPLPSENEYMIYFNERCDKAPFDTNEIKKTHLKKKLQSLGLPYWCRGKLPFLGYKNNSINDLKKDTWYILWEWWYKPEDISYNFL